MAKRKKLATAPLAGSEADMLRGNEQAEQMNHLMESMETYTKHSIECWSCGKRETERDTTEARFARELFADGWRYVESKRYATIGAACPKCAKNPDSDGWDD